MPRGVYGSGMTPAQRRALEVLWEHGPLEREAFAKAMWPKSPVWGQLFLGEPPYALMKAATTFLGRLKRMGLVTDSEAAGWRNPENQWQLSGLGRRVLRREQILEKIA